MSDLGVDKLGDSAKLNVSSEDPFTNEAKMITSGWTGRYARVAVVGKRYPAFDVHSGEDLSEEIGSPTRSKAGKADVLIGEYVSSTSGRTYWKVSKIPANTPVGTLDSPAVETPSVSVSPDPVEAAFSMRAIMNDVDLEDKESVVTFVHKKAASYKPETLIIPELKWRYLMRSALRGENILMTGPSGCGKTFAVQCVSDAFPERKHFYFNLGATQDPRGTLIGNTQAASGDTFFGESHFVKAIRTPGAIILLDELSRAHPEAWNILMTVLDKKQRYLRLDEKEDTETVKVAPGVTFIGTANIGAEYTATRTMDRALLDRFVMIEMDVLNDVEEADLLLKLHPELTPEMAKAIGSIGHATRKSCFDETGQLSAMVSTRASVEIAALVVDGFTLAEAAEVAIYPFFDNEGGVDSERTYVRQLVQGFLPVEEEEDELFTNVKGSLDNIPF